MLKPITFFVVGMVLISGCGGGAPVETIAYVEPDWVREGEPVILQEVKWYPLDVIEHFEYREMVYVDEYKGQKVFVEKRDVKPYDRLYMKIDPLTFRAFKQKKE